MVHIPPPQEETKRGKRVLDLFIIGMINRFRSLCFCSLCEHFYNKYKEFKNSLYA